MKSTSVGKEAQIYVILAITKIPNIFINIYKIRM